MRRSLLKPILAGFLCLAPVSAFAWGAIAVDDEKGSSNAGFGYVTGEDSEKAAERGAMKECRARNKSCKVAITFESCGAYAASANRWGTGEGVTKGAARRIALANCGNEACKLVVAQCDE
jgi:hypothetical protein